MGVCEVLCIFKLKKVFNLFFMNYDRQIKLFIFYELKNVTILF